MKLTEGLDYHDMKRQVIPLISVDEYAAKMGDDHDIVTLAFILKSELAAKDLTSWLEIGYDFILDASVSEGELEPGKWIVFAEMKRRSNIPDKIIQILEDLKTLTDLNVDDYKIKVDGKEYDADSDTLKQVIILSPNEYQLNKEDEEELNEMRNLAGLEYKNIHEIDQEIRKYITNAGL